MTRRSARRSASARHSSPPGSTLRALNREDQSTSTEENLRFSAERIRAAGLSTNVVIASDNFHQLRAALWGKALRPDALCGGCRTAWFLAPGYWAREIAGVAYTLLT